MNKKVNPKDSQPSSANQAQSSNYPGAANYPRAPGSHTYSAAPGASSYNYPGQRYPAYDRQVQGGDGYSGPPSGSGAYYADAYGGYYAGGYYTAGYNRAIGAGSQSPPVFRVIVRAIIHFRQIISAVFLASIVLAWFVGLGSAQFFKAEAQLFEPSSRQVGGSLSSVLRNNPATGGGGLSFEIDLRNLRSYALSEIALLPVVHNLDLPLSVNIANNSTWKRFLIARQRIYRFFGVPLQKNEHGVYPPLFWRASHAAGGEEIQVQVSPESDSHRSVQAQLRYLGNERVEFLSVTSLVPGQQTDHLGKLRIAADGKPIVRHLNEPLEIDDITITVESVKANPGLVFFISRQSDQLAITQLSRQLTYFLDSKTVTVAYSHQVPETALKLLQAWIDSLRETDLQITVSSFRQQLEAIERARPHAVAAVDAAENELAKFLSDFQIIDGHSEAAAAAGEARQYRQQIERNLLALREASSRVTAEHPLVQDAERSVELRRLFSQEAQVAATQRAASYARLDSLKTTLESALESYHQLLNREASLALELASARPNLRVSRSPHVPANGVTTTLGLVVQSSIVFVLTLVAVAFSVLLRLSGITRVVSNADITEACGQNVSARLPELTSESDVAKQNAYANALPDSEIITVNQITNLVGAIDLSTPESHSGQLNIAITSRKKGEGKTHLALHMVEAIATNTAHLRDTLLVDCDLHLGRVSKAFDLPKDTQGLAQILRGTASWEDCIKQTENPRLHVVCAGHLQSSSDKGKEQTISSLVRTSNVVAMFQQIPQQYSTVILDLPPLELPYEVGIFAGRADTLVYVIEAGKHTSRQVSSGVRAIARLGVSQIHLVVNRDKLELSNFEKLVEKARTLEQKIRTRFLPD